MSDILDDYVDAKAKGLTSLEFGEGTSTIVLRRGYEQHSGVPVLLPQFVTGVDHLNDLEVDVDARLAPLLARKAGIVALRDDVKAKDAERQALTAANEKKDVTANPNDNPQAAG